MSIGTKSVLYLDLECTIIDVFSAGNLMNVNKIRHILQDYGINEVGIFSFAVLDNKDRKDFYHRIAPSIEEALGVKIIMCPTIHDMMRADFNITGNKWNTDNRLDVSEWVNLRGKVDAFHLWAKKNGKPNDKYILVDDVVPNMAMHYEDTNLWVKYINIDRYKGACSGHN